MWFQIKKKAIRLALLSGVLAGTSLLLSGEAVAQSPILSQLYGKGVHAFFDGDYQAAHEYLTEAIDGRSRDPRAYYFRAMAYYRLGRPEEAAEDMATGARLEVADVNQFYPVSRSLERVQGRGRIVLEKHRRDARLEQYQRARDRQRQRFGDGDDLPSPKATAPQELPTDDAADAAPVGETDDSFKAEGDPFGDDPVREDDAAAGDTEDADPFGDASAEEDVDLFGDDAADGTEEGEDEDAFGEDVDDGDLDGDLDEDLDEGDGFAEDDDDLLSDADTDADASAAEAEEPPVATASAEEKPVPQAKLGKDGAKAIGRGVLKLFGVGGGKSGESGSADGDDDEEGDSDEAFADDEASSEEDESLDEDLGDDELDDEEGFGDDEDDSDEDFDFDDE